MKYCKKCNSQISTRTWINGKLRVTNKRSYCLVCSPFGSKNTKDIHQELGISGDRWCVCEICKKDFLYSRTKCNSTIRCYGCTQRERRRTTKQYGIDLKGGKCQLCGYSRCISSLTFHHLDPKEKEFNISSCTFSQKRIQEEFEKCILVCRNCHGELESGLVTWGAGVIG